jgi:hypothetical protein
MSGRHSVYSEELADQICDQLMDGKSLVKICAQDGMPHRSTVIRWMADDPDFATRCARARDAQADLMDDKILDVADASTSETAAADRVKIAAYQWRASKLAPKKYGDKLDLNHSGSIGTMSEEQVNARLAELLGKAGIGRIDGPPSPTDPVE